MRTYLLDVLSNWNQIMNLKGTTPGVQIPSIVPLNTFPCYGVNDKSTSGRTLSTKRSVLERSPTPSRSTSKPPQPRHLRHTSPSLRRPQYPDQSNLTAQQGADLWGAHMQPLKAQGILLGSPAPTNAPSGKTWLQDFLTACDGGCTVDFIALHWYGINSTQFVLYLQDIHNTFKRPIWVTEWACQVSTSSVPSHSPGT